MTWTKHARRAAATLVVTLTTIGPWGVATAQNTIKTPITQLFGITPGTPVDDLTTTGPITIEKGLLAAPEWIAPVRVPTANEAFQTYTVRFNPETRAVYQIEGQARARQTPCAHLLQAFKRVIARKYPEYTRHEDEGRHAGFHDDSGMFPRLSLLCHKQVLHLRLIDNALIMAHLKQNKNRSIVSEDGL